MLEVKIKTPCGEKNWSFVKRVFDAHQPMLEALENLENDDGHIPRGIWELVQTAIKKATRVKKC